ncbi:unnamed protein product [Ilex paraguariensis]|uniref:DUF4378 domain-containing protein n=1 Tax=Ilex paraguariensis TaxID=185542 RepID=A0ABC8V4L3_9AQUA
MGKHFWNKHDDDEFEDYHPSCMWGIIHALDYHHWHSNVKRLLPHKKRVGRRPVSGNKNSKIRLNDDSCEVQKLLDDEASQFFVYQSPTKLSLTKRFLKARIKALIAEEISKEEGHKRQGPSQPQLQRTCSIHHLEPSDLGLDEICSNLKHPVIFLENSADNGAPKPFACSKQFDVCSTKDTVNMEPYWLADNHKFSPEKDKKAKEIPENQKLKKTMKLGSHHQRKMYADVLEIYMVNKDLFLKSLQDRDDGDCSQSLQSSYRRARLNRSGSFPMADLANRRNLRPSKLKHKQNEIWSLSKGEKSLAGTQVPKFASSKFSEIFRTNSGLLTADGSGGNLLNQEKCSVSLDSTQELDKQGNNELIIHLRDTKQRALPVDGGKTESGCASLNPPLGRIPNGYSPSNGDKEMAERCEYSSSSLETDGSIYDLRKSMLTHRRTSSLNESLDKYSRLFEYTFSREPNRHHSRSLSLMNEYEIPSGGHAPMSFTRIRSLSQVESYYCFHQNEVSHDGHVSEMPISTVLDISEIAESESQDEPRLASLPTSTKMYETPNPNEQTESLNYKLERNDSSRMEYLASSKVGIAEEGTPTIDGFTEEVDELAVEERDSHKEGDMTFTEMGNDELRPTDISVSEGLDFGCNFLEEKELPLNSKKKSGTDFLSRSDTIVNLDESFEHAKKISMNYRHIELHSKEDAHLMYVRHVLERSGIIGNGLLGTWNSSDQALDPSVFEEVEACWSIEPECSGEDMCSSCYRNNIFDLVNEVLLQVFDRSFTYYPKSLSSTCRVHSMPMGHHILEEVWASIGKSLTLKPELDQTMDCIVARNLAKDDGWMNLQLESEWVALELEDIIFDELLEEIISS